ncbi:MAG: Crp/Fnr family transcriptional regulator [Acidobacteriota bacterium]
MKPLTLDAPSRAAALGASPLLQGLAPQDLECLARIASARRYEAGEVLFLAGDEAAGFFLVLTGQVKVSRFGADGREQVIHLLGPGQPCGEVPVFEGGAYPATASALGRVDSLFLARAAFLELAGRRPQILLGMLAILSRRLRALVDLVDDLSLKEVAARLARHLLALQREAGGDRVELETAKGTLASRLGMSPETLSRTLAKLQRQRLISVEGRTVRILDRPGLEGL